MNPNSTTCLLCKTATNNPKFCSKSCAARYNNKGRVRSYESKLKTSVSVKKVVEKHPDKFTRGGYFPSHRLRHARMNKGITRVLNIYFKCVACDIPFANPSTVQTCSKKCRYKLIGMKKSESLKKAENRTNLGRGKKSWLESSFEKWLENHKFKDFHMEYKVYNPNLKKTYFVDFMFPTKNLVVELDGTQHRNTIEQDRVRDEFLTSLGYRVIRIPYSEYRSKAKVPELQKILGFGDPGET